MGDSPVLHLFEACGVELEYMLVRRDTLDVCPVTDEVLKAVAGTYVNDVERGVLDWSNELALHVVELKTARPAPKLAGLAVAFQHEVAALNELAGAFDARLMPGAMHPWMDPDAEMKLWPHDYNPVYETFNRIFDCRGHGWANLQSVHLNLPFYGDEEFGRLHAAIRLLLPILPALAAASPYQGGAFSGRLDGRLEAYRHHGDRVPSMVGRVVPEPVFTHAAYQNLLEGLYRDLAPHDPEGTLRFEWANARGAIARFDRNAIEIRVLDVQEHPAADLGLCALIVAVLQALCDERWSPLAAQQAWPVTTLEPILLSTIRDADEARIEDGAYLKSLGYVQSDACTAGELWRHLFKTLEPAVADRAPETLNALRHIVTHGPLARRLLRRGGKSPSRETLHGLYAELSDCLRDGRPFS